MHNLTSKIVRKFGIMKRKEVIVGARYTRRSQSSSKDILPESGSESFKAGRPFVGTFCLDQALFTSLCRVPITFSLVKLQQRLSAVSDWV